jgi:hypothetical protein
MKRQEEQGYCDVCKYLSIFISALCLFVFLSRILCLCPPGHFVQTRKTPSNVASSGGSSTN